MRISDLSSDVCSFDLIASSRPLTQVALRAIAALQGLAETLRQKDGVQMGESLEITFHGAARTVTGSCMQLRYGDLAVLIDCGLFQGSRTLETLNRSEEHTSELQSLMRISYAVFCLKKTKRKIKHTRKDM